MESFRKISVLAGAAAMACGAIAARATVIDYSGSIVTFTAPADGYYDITAAGGGGEGGSFGSPGDGAIVVDTFQLTAGEKLDLLAGGGGVVTSQNDDSGGGGGGSFVVVDSTQSPLLVAGGGGGGGFFNVSATSGGGPTSPGDGSGGAGGIGTGGGGGGGFTGNGSHGGNSNAISDGGGGGFSYTSGGAGGANGVLATGPNAVTAGSGGFGGGGGGGVNGGGGGGGGYTGGQGGDHGFGGSGGTSFSAGAAPSLLGTSGGNGSISIVPADVINFIAKGNFDNGILDGNVVIDTTRGVVLSADLTADGQAFNTVVEQVQNAGAYTLEFDENGDASNILQINIPQTSSLVGFGGNDQLSGVIGGVTINDTLENGSLELVPEPTSMGVLVMAGLTMLRRRRG